MRFGCSFLVFCGGFERCRVKNKRRVRVYIAQSIDGVRDGRNIDDGWLFFPKERGRHDIKLCRFDFSRSAEAGTFVDGSLFRFSVV